MENGDSASPVSLCIPSPDNERWAAGAAGEEERLRPPHNPTLSRHFCSSELPVTPRWGAGVVRSQGLQSAVEYAPSAEKCSQEKPVISLLRLLYVPCILLTVLQGWNTQLLKRNKNKESKRLYFQNKSLRTISHIQISSRRTLIYDITENWANNLSVRSALVFWWDTGGCLQMEALLLLAGRFRVWAFWTAHSCFPSTKMSCASFLQRKAHEFTVSLWCRRLFFRLVHRFIFFPWYVFRLCLTVTKKGKKMMDDFVSLTGCAQSDRTGEGNGEAKVKDWPGIREEWRVM